MNDKNIVDLYFNRDEEAITQTDKKYGRYCYSIACNILTNKEDAEESVSDTYMTAWRAIPPRRPSVLATFLGKITRHISIDRWRERSAYKRGGMYGMTMCMSIYRGLGMDEEAVLCAVTSSAARAAKRENAWGSLKVGGAADIAVLSYGKQKIDISDRAGNRVVLDEGYSCHLTVANGKILYRNGI